MTTPSGFRMEQAMATLQRALAEAPDADGVIADPIEATDDCMELLARVLRGAVEADTLADGAKDRMADLQARKARFEARRDQLRGIAFAAMDALELRKLELPDMTVSIKANAPRVVITDEAMLPDGLCNIKRTPDKSAIRVLLKAGQTVIGAVMSNSLPSLSIRTR